MQESYSFRFNNVSKYRRDVHTEQLESGQPAAASKSPEGARRESSTDQWKDKMGKFRTAALKRMGRNKSMTHLHHVCYSAGPKELVQRLKTPAYEKKKQVASAPPAQTCPIRERV